MKPWAPSWIQMENRPVGEPIIVKGEHGEDNLQPLEVWFRCRRCGRESQLVFPVTGIEWAKFAADFADVHRSCSPSPK